MILDDELAELYSLFPLDTKIIVHFDSCFSAKSDRGVVANLTDRYVRRRKPRGISEYDISEETITETYARRPAANGPRRGALLLSACRHFETAADAKFGKEYRGAMTYFVEQAIKSLGPEATYLEVNKRARAGLKAAGFSQIPQVEEPAEWLNLPIYT